MEVQLAYLVSDKKNYMNHPIYAIQEDMGSYRLHLDDDTIVTLQVETNHTVQHNMEVQYYLW